MWSLTWQASTYLHILEAMPVLHENWWALIAQTCQLCAHWHRYVLRNWIAQNAIQMAEKGDYSEVERVLRLLEQPFSGDTAQGGVTAAQSCERSLQYDGPVPQWAKRLCVSCSS